MSGIGPVEPGEGTAPDGHLPAPADILTAGGPDRLDRWAALPRRRRGALAAVAALLAAATGYAYSVRSASPDPVPAPWPAQTTQVHYAGIARPADPHSRAFTFRFRVVVDRGPDVTVRDITQSYEGIATAVAPAPPFTVQAGTSVRIMIKMYVRDCTGLPDDAVSPFLDVTLRNTSAIQVQSFILGGRYPDDLSAAMHTVCPQPAASTRPRLTAGTAHSHHADHTTKQ